MALLSEKLRDRIRDQGRVIGREEGLAQGLSKGLSQGRDLGHAQASADWRKWFERYEEARRKGVSFDEPPPDRR